MISHTIQRYIETEQLCLATDKLLVALSGGADSVALLRILLRLGYTCEAAHCNFNLRGQESNRDEQFVRQLCNQFEVPLHVIDFDTKQYAAEQKVSIEMAARELRYQWFEELRKETHCTYIAVAHHLDDSVETTLLNLIRGTGINGLTGIRPRHQKVIRPLLCINRSSIIAYLQQIDQSYVTDSTNLQDEYTRNKIRLNILPLMEELNPSVKESIAKTSQYINEALQVYNAGIASGKKRIMQSGHILIDALLQEPSPRCLLHEVLYPLGFNATQLEDLLRAIHTGQTGKLFYGKDNWKATIDRNRVLIEQEIERANPPFELIYTPKEIDANYQIPRNKNIACLDADKLTGKFEIRKYKQGDWFIPFGMKGRKLLSDFLTNLKLSRSQKENQWILCCGEDIVWVIGERTDNRFRIDEKTKHIIEIEIKY